MDGFILFIIIAGIALFLYSSRKRRVAEIEQSFTRKTKPAGGINPSPSSMDVRNAVVQILETTAIMASSKNIDTIQGRAEFLKERIETIKWAYLTPRYKTDLQHGLDQYKTTYYSTDVHAWQVNVLTEPYSFIFDLFYAKCLFNGFKRYYEKQLEEIGKLKRDSAIKNRYDNLAQKLNEVKSILPTLTDSSDVYRYRESIKPEIGELEKQIKSNT